MYREEHITSIFAANVFNDVVMRERLPRSAYQSLRKTIDEGAQLDPAIAEVVANAMKDWALEKGATHFCHWFQPMTGLTAQKHDAFISPTSEGRVIAQLSGKELIKGEPDASSFPNGGIRATFEARGYTAWDCTSPAFIKDGVLCIPTAFCSYHGEALDKKTPLLRSMEAISKQALRILHLLGDTNVKKVTPSVGAEQEYFLIDKSHYTQRKDLIFTGRTLLGCPPPKGQELEDHYFGTIKERVLAFMKQVNIELWQLGVAVKTEHNEVAPCQFELAPVFNTANVATDQNQLVMDVLKKTASKFDLVCLLHEKPFAGVNGSGKHVNWSLSTNTGANLLEPGETPHQNIQFLIFLCAVIKAVDQYPELLRLAASNPGNDHRLGANEAPPAIVSIFLGDKLTHILEQMERGMNVSDRERDRLLFGVNTIPPLPQDSTDRNRTSSFAFTGNKFEFRMVASSLSIAGPCFALNTIVADALREMADYLEQSDDLHSSITQLLRDIIKKHKRVLFNGDGYSQKWVKEAERRGLPNIKSYVESIPYLISSKVLEVFERSGVLNSVELHSRYEIFLQLYCKHIRIEALTLLDMVKRHIMPVAMTYTARLAKDINEIQKTGLSVSTNVQKNSLTQISQIITEVDEEQRELEAAVYTDSPEDLDSYETALHYRKDVFEAMQKLRRNIDKLETLIDKKLWPWPGYDDILFGI